MSIASDLPPKVNKNTPASVPAALLDRLPADQSDLIGNLNGELRVEIVSSLAELQPYAAAWDDLGRHASEPNPFYERWMLEPAEQLFERLHPQFVLVFRGSKRRDVPEQLVGLFPFVVNTTWLRSGRWELWGHPYCYLRTPLVRLGHEVETFTAMFTHLRRLPGGPSITEWPLQVAHGRLAQALVDVLYDRRLLVKHVSVCNRAFMTRGKDWQSYLGQSTSNGARREWRRLWRRLSDISPLHFRSLDSRSPADLEHWLEQFLALEASGWKGAQGTALVQQQAAVNFFRSAACSAFAQQRLQMLGLYMGDRPIAMKVNFLAGDGAFAFKIAYDEEFARYSPGIHLEFENIRSFHEDTPQAWMDSCAVPGHTMINRVWGERRTIQHLRICTGRPLGNLAIGVRCFIRAVSRCFSSAPPPSVPLAAK